MLEEQNNKKEEDEEDWWKADVESIDLDDSLYYSDEDLQDSDSEVSLGYPMDNNDDMEEPADLAHLIGIAGMFLVIGKL